MSGVAVVGRGTVGAALVDALRAAGTTVRTVTRGGPPAAEHEPCDLGDEHGRGRLLQALRRWDPSCVVLTHGPSDVTWMERHPDEAAAAHAGAAEAVAAHCGPRTLLVSTDNVFSGAAGLRTAADPPDPANVYGRVKLAAERAVLAAGGRVVRVSLVYGGWSTGTRRVTFAERCLTAARSGLVLQVPHDQDFTPVHVGDVAAVLVGLCAVAGHAGSRLTHLAGPEQLSRYAFARRAYRLAGADDSLVLAVPRARSEWASRPRYSSLRCDDFAEVTGVRGWRPASVEEGLRRMLTAVPGTEAVR